MIIGVTHNEDRQPKTRLTIAHKVSIGLPPDEKSNYPRRLDHFHFVTKSAKGEWIQDTELMKMLTEKYGRDGKIREFDIVLLSDNTEEIFRTELAWWSATQCLCRGNGAEAKRRDQEGQWHDWTPCGRECKDLRERRCKPSGDLYLMLADRPVIGSVATFHTSGYESIIRLSSSLQQIGKMTGGRFKGLRLKLVMRPYEARYQHNGKAKTSLQYAVNLEFREDDYQRLIPRLVEGALSADRHLTEAQRKALPSGEHEPDDRSEFEYASEIEPEFYPAEEEPETYADVEKRKDEIDEELFPLEVRQKVHQAAIKCGVGDKGALNALLELQKEIQQKQASSQPFSEKALKQYVNDRTNGIVMAFQSVKKGQPPAQANDTPVAEPDPKQQHPAVDPENPWLQDVDDPPPHEDDDEPPPPDDLEGLFA